MTDGQPAAGMVGQGPPYAAAERADGDLLAGLEELLAAVGGEATRAVRRTPPEPPERSFNPTKVR